MSNQINLYPLDSNQLGLNQLSLDQLDPQIQDLNNPLNLETPPPSNQSIMNQMMRSQLLSNLKEAITKMTDAVTQWNQQLLVVIKGGSV